MTAWAAQWQQCNRLDGERRHLLRDVPGDPAPALFRTRDAARHWIRERFGYIAKRPDLRAEPHGWRTPRPVRVTVAVDVVS